MKTGVLPDLLVEPQLLADVTAVLHDGETVSEFVESAIRRTIERRRSLAEFNARGEAAWQEYQRTGQSHSLDEVLTELRAMTARRHKQIGR